VPAEEIGHWFQSWFDPDDNRDPVRSDLSGYILFSSVEDDRLDRDPGTAAVGEMLELIGMPDEVGAQKIVVTASYRDLESKD
jgi:hypothetical protein